MPKVFVTRKLPERGIKVLVDNSFEVEVYAEDFPIPKNKLIDEVKKADALLCLLTDKIDSEVINANPKLKIISNYAVGLDNIDVEYATSKKIPVTNTPEVLTDSVAEHTIALMLAVARHITQSDKFLRSGVYKGWSPMLFLGRELKGKMLGIVGLGRVGSSVAMIASKGFGMEILYFNRSRDFEFEKNYGAKYLSLQELLAVSDFVSLHVPLTNETKHLIGAKELALMKKSVYLINTSRGPVVNEKDLVETLKKKKIAGAALDVFEFEPDLSKGLTQLTNVVLTPHIASATFEAREKMAELAAAAIVDIFAGRIPKNIVNKQVFDK